MLYLCAYTEPSGNLAFQIAYQQVKICIKQILKIMLTGKKGVSVEVRDIDENTMGNGDNCWSWVISVWGWWWEGLFSISLFSLLLWMNISIIKYIGPKKVQVFLLLDSCISFHKWSNRLSTLNISVSAQSLQFRSLLEADKTGFLNLQGYRTYTRLWEMPPSNALVRVPDGQPAMLPLEVLLSHLCR